MPRGTGKAQMPPSMMLSLLIYNYAVGRMSSRQIIKSAMGFRHFLLRGMCKVAREWSLVTLAYKFRRLARLIPAATTRCHGDFALKQASVEARGRHSPI